MIGKDRTIRMFGKYRGIVREYDDSEELKLRRIRVELPSMGKENLTPWALPCTITQMDWLPKKGDLVWIEFEMGDPRFPIYVGLLKAKDDISQEFLDEYNELYRRDYDYNGNVIEWTDGGFIVTDKNENKVETTEDGIKVTDKNDNIIEMNGDGVKIECKNGNTIEMTSSNVDINGGKFTVKVP